MAKTKPIKTPGKTVHVWVADADSVTRNALAIGKEEGRTDGGTIRFALREYAERRTPPTKKGGAK